jgi:hypothetical protein
MTYRYYTFCASDNILAISFYRFIDFTCPWLGLRPFFASWLDVRQTSIPPSESSWRNERNTFLCTRFQTCPSSWNERNSRTHQSIVPPIYCTCCALIEKEKQEESVIMLETKESTQPANTWTRQHANKTPTKELTLDYPSVASVRDASWILAVGAGLDFELAPFCCCFRSCFCSFLCCWSVDYLLITMPSKVPSSHRRPHRRLFSWLLFWSWMDVQTPRLIGDSRVCFLWKGDNASRVNTSTVTWRRPSLGPNNRGARKRRTTAKDADLYVAS